MSIGALWHMCVTMIKKSRCGFMIRMGWPWPGGRKEHAERFNNDSLGTVIPVVTFLTPLAEYFSDLKDR